MNKRIQKGLLFVGVFAIAQSPVIIIPLVRGRSPSVETVWWWIGASILFGFLVGCVAPFPKIRQE